MIVLKFPTGDMIFNPKHKIITSEFKHNKYIIINVHNTNKNEQFILL